MRCPKCQMNNKEGIKFCIECGHKFELKCPQCGHSLPQVAKFCEECGHQLTKPSKLNPKELSFDENLRKFQKYLPGGLTEKILAQRGKIEGERKRVTVMFCDMAELTDDLCKEIGIVLGGIAPLPVVAGSAEAVVRGKRLAEGLIAEAVEAALEEAKPLPMNDYKIDLTRALVRRALMLISREAPQFDDNPPRRPVQECRTMWSRSCAHSCHIL